MLADGNAEFTRAMGLEMDGTGFGMGMRCRRFGMIVEDGTVTSWRGSAGRDQGQLGGSNAWTTVIC